MVKKHCVSCVWMKMHNSFSCLHSFQSSVYRAGLQHCTLPVYFVPGERMDCFTHGGASRWEMRCLTIELALSNRKCLCYWRATLRPHGVRLRTWFSWFYSISHKFVNIKHPCILQWHCKSLDTNKHVHLFSSHLKDMNTLHA